MAYHQLVVLHIEKHSLIKLSMNKRNTQTVEITACVFLYAKKSLFGVINGHTSVVVAEQRKGDPAFGENRQDSLNILRDCIILTNPAMIIHQK